jgi:glycosyltransferase involved in cell wall biosynthesis
MRVLHVTAALAPRLGGPSKVAVELCEALAARGMEVTLFSTNLGEQGRWCPFASPVLADVPTDRSTWINGVERRYFEVAWPSRLACSPDMARAVRERIRRFDLVHVHSLYQFTTTAASHYAQRWRVPYIVRPHGTLDPYLRRRHAVRKAVYDRVVQRGQLDRAAAIHYTSQDELELARPLGIRAPGVVVPLGVNVREFDPLPPRGCFRARHPGLEGKRLIVFLGRLTQKKGIDLLVQAFARLATEFPDAHLVLAGPEDSGFGRIVQGWVDSAGLRHRTTTTGILLGRQKLELLADTDIWVLPSYTENFAMAAVEALACGLPVVLTDRVNIHAELSGAGAGLVVGCDPGELATAIRRLLTDEGLRRRLMAAGPGLVRGRFTWDRAAERMVEVYESTCERTGAIGRVVQT